MNSGKMRSSPFANQDELPQVYDAEIRDIRTPRGTPVVPVRKASNSSDQTDLRIGGDYSVTVYCSWIFIDTLCFFEELMRRLGGGYELMVLPKLPWWIPKSRQRLALNTVFLAVFIQYSDL